MAKYTEYDVAMVKEGLLGTLLTGSSGFPLSRLRDELNARATDGWDVVFQIIEQRRLMLFWKREAVIVTFGR